jgi:hypothetical protein
MSRLILVRLTLLIASVAVSRGGTAYTYTYQGRPYTQVNGAYAATDSISGYVELSSPLPANSGGSLDVWSEVVALDFSDGLGAVTLANCNTLGGPCDVAFTTAAGKITDWDVNLQLSPFLDDIKSTPSRDLVSYGHLDVFAENLNDPGSWTPEPASFFLASLFGLLLVVFSFARRRLRDRTEPS